MQYGDKGEARDGVEAVAVAPAPYGNYMGTPGSEGLLGPAHGHYTATPTN